MDDWDEVEAQHLANMTKTKQQLKILRRLAKAEQHLARVHAQQERLKAGKLTGRDLLEIIFHFPMILYLYIRSKF